LTAAKNNIETDFKNIISVYRESYPGRSVQQLNFLELRSIGQSIINIFNSSELVSDLRFYESGGYNQFSNELSHMIRAIQDNLASEVELRSVLNLIEVHLEEQRFHLESSSVVEENGV
jgi:hypothetical protein